MKINRPKIPQDMPMKVVLAGLLVFSFAQYIAKSAILSAIDEIKDRKKNLRENI